MIIQYRIYLLHIFTTIWLMLYIRFYFIKFLINLFMFLLLSKWA